MSNPGPVLSAGNTVAVCDAVPTPSMRGTITGWFRPIIVGVVTSKIQDDGSDQPFVREINTSGVLQPRGERLQRYAEGGRSWGNWTLHCYPNLTLNTNDRITVKGVFYTVLGKEDFTAYGYVQYDLEKAPQK